MIKKISLALSAVILISFISPSFAIGHKNKLSPEKVAYHSDGHYWTVFLVATLLGLPNAPQLAFYAEHPDNIMKEDGYVKRGTYTWLLLHKQGKVHALTGKIPTNERERSRRMYTEGKDIKRKGQALHRLGDSYAHAKPDEAKMYSRGFGHAFTPEGGNYPDMIRNFPEKYLTYVQDLTKVLGGPEAEIDMTAFKYIAEKKLETEDNIEILKSEIHIQKNKSEFFINEKCKNSLTDYLIIRASIARFLFSFKEIENQKKKKNKPGRVLVVLAFES